MPIRTCISCGESSDKRSLVRVVKSPQGDIALDPSGRAAGRGAYICETTACFENAYKKRLFDKRLRSKLGKEDYEKLKSDFEALMQERKALL